ncbi:hypothetical protein POTOM_015818 [Populus tomentosa]|uniref:TLC domain-containing protein n=1 Tax=Populus tomentosa TaxID=118781 RepID=A0A8X8D6G8_POPTO|nr:hypothetical protein POTOM_015818 [Populus tomentosa]
MDPILTLNGSANPSHFLLPIYFAFSFFLARFVLDRFIFRKLAIWLMYSKAKAISSRIDEATIVKCSESMWKLTYYATVEICVLKITYNEPWFRDTKEYFRGWPNQELGFPIMLFYMCQCGFYIYSIAALLIWETRRKDFSVMMSHHVITVILIGYSYSTSFFRIGTIICAVHDASDVFLEAAKVFKYSGKELRASILFGLFAISWVILRLVFFPFWIIKATRFVLVVDDLISLILAPFFLSTIRMVFLSYELVEFLDLSLAYDKLLYYVFNTMLLMLLVFHIYWWILIYSMIMRQLRNRGRVGEDIRSDSEDDE